MKKTYQFLSGAAGATMLLSGCAASIAPEAPIAEVPITEEAHTEEAHIETAYDVVSVREEKVEYNQVANINGQFHFNQDTLTPGDDIFNIFGTVLTGMCAKPGFSLENDKVDYYINIGGKIKHSYTVSLNEFADQETERILLCVCATGAATANAQITGVKLSDVLSLAELQEDVNTITVRGSDGYGLAMPLSYALEKEAMIVYKVNDQKLPSSTQFWVPGTVAKYFTRDVVDIELTAQAEAPVVDQRSDDLRAEVSILNAADDCCFLLGDEIAFEGFADDCGDAIAAVEFSLDGGVTWTAYETSNASPERWVYWNFSYTPEVAGTYKLDVRARTQCGTVSPLAATLVFTVEPGAPI